MTVLHWRDTGSGPVVVLLHAFPCDGSMWDAQVAPLTDAGWRVLVPDLPGFGESALPNSAPSLSTVVDLLATSLLERSVDRCVLVGLSVGGYLAMEWLRRYPDMLAGIVLCDTKASADGPEAQAGRLGMADAIDADPSAVSLLLRDRVLPVIVGSTTSMMRPEVVGRVSAWIDIAKPATVSWYQRAMAARPDSLSTLGECDLPALVVWGDEDLMSPRGEQDAMLNVLRDGRLAVIPSAGHLSAIENPGQVATEVVDFLSAIRRISIDG